MNTAPNNQDRIFEQAVRWVEMLRSGIGERAAFFAWLAESPRHVQELNFALALMEDISGLDLEHRKQIEALAAEHGTREGAAADNVVVLERPHLTPALSTPEGRKERWKWAAAAGVAAVVLSAWAWIAMSGAQNYATGIGEQRTLQLDDGSTVHLDAHSRLEVRFTASARELRLSEGEALFKVAKDAARPFTVTADETVIQALGTQFNVHRRPSGTVVSVLEGAVKVSTNTASTAGRPGALKAETLAAGDEIRIGSRGRPLKRAKADVQNVTAWRQHRLVFQDDTLADIAAEFNRHNAVPRIQVEGESARTRRFAGTFDADAPQALIEALQTDQELVVERTPREIAIRVRNSSSER